MSRKGIKKTKENQLKNNKDESNENTIKLNLIIKAICKNSNNLTDNDLKNLDSIKVHFPQCVELKNLIDDFKNMFRESNTSLESWLLTAKAFNIKELNSFVSGIERDIISVKNSLNSTYTNGLLEGMVNKVKGTKRISYGRCNFDLLRTKVLNSQVIYG